jgi:hypothetical protein
MTILLATDSSLSADPAILVQPAHAVLPLPLVDDGVAATILSAATAAEPFVVVVRPALARPARRAVVESFADPTAVIACVAALSQLGARLLVHLLTAVEAQYGTAAAAELAGPLTAAVESRLVLSTVSRLDDPAPSVAQHVRSWLPGATFQVLSGRRRAVLSGLAEAAGRRTPRTDELSLFASSAGCPPALREGARALAQLRPCVELPPWPEPGHETAGRWAELVTWSPSEVQAIVSRWVARTPVPCRWCARPSRLPVCASCGALAGPASPVPTEEAQPA